MVIGNGHILDRTEAESNGSTYAQSQQLLNVIQSRSEPHPDAILLEPVGGTALPQVVPMRAALSRIRPLWS